MRIKAAVARRHDAPLALEGVDLDDPRGDEIVVRLVAAGVAQADLEAVAGRLPMPLPFVPGSEGAGIVEHVGDAVVGLSAGDAVVVGDPRSRSRTGAAGSNGRRSDGSAPFATDAEGSRAAAVNGFFLGASSFATHLVCRAEHAVKLPSGAALELLACLGGELLVGAAAVTASLAVGEGDTLVITGADAVGLVACMVARARGAGTIIVADPSLAGRNLALECGATVAVHTDDGLSTMVRSLVADGARFAIDTTGHAEAITACLDSLGPGGTCALLHPTIGLPDDLRGRGSGGETILVGQDVEAVPASTLPGLAALHAAGKLPLERIVTFFPFELVNDAMAALAARAIVKPVLRFPVGSFGEADRALDEGAARDESDPTPETAPEPAPEPEVEAPALAPAAS